MQKNYISRFRVLGVVFLTLITIGCAANKSGVRALQSDLVLQYRFPKDQALTYKGGADVVQNQEVMGQSMTTTIKIGAGYSIKGTGVDDQNNLMTRIVINNVELAINSMQGNMNPDTSALSGKSFDATYSPQGKELKVSGIEDLPKISLGAGGERSAKDFFTDLLPVLPDAAVKTGDTWTTPVERNMQQGPISLAFKGEEIHVFEGIETIQGMECAVIKTRTESTVEGSGSQMGLELKISGAVKGTATFYFAYEKGLFVKITNDSTTDMKIDAGTMVVPQIEKSKSQMELVL